MQYRIIDDCVAMVSYCEFFMLDLVNTIPLCGDVPRLLSFIFPHCCSADSLCPPLQGRGVLGERSAWGHELLLLSGPQGLHQGNQHQAALPEDQHAAGTPDGQGAAGPHCHTQGKEMGYTRTDMLVSYSSKK